MSDIDPTDKPADKHLFKELDNSKRKNNQCKKMSAQNTQLIAFEQHW